MNFKFSPGIERYKNFIYTNPDQWAFNLIVFFVAAVMAYMFPDKIAFAILLALIPLVPKIFHFLGTPEGFFFGDFDEQSCEKFSRQYAEDMTNHGMSIKDIEVDIRCLKHYFDDEDAKSTLSIITFMVTKTAILNRLREEQTNEVSSIQ